MPVESPQDPTDAVEPPTPPGGVAELHRPERRRRLTEAAIVAAALRVASTHGVAAVTMRRVAGELGVAASSLYPHVGSRERLLDLAVREVLGGAEPLPDSGDWREDLRRHFIDLHARLTAHADLAQHAFFAAVAPCSAEDLTRLEALLGRLTAVGLDPAVVVTAHDRLRLYTVADVYEAWQRRQRVDDADVAVWLGSFEAYAAELPEERFPHLRAHARQAVAPDAMTRFVAGLDLILDGLAARAAGA